MLEICARCYSSLRDPFTRDEHGDCRWCRDDEDWVVRFFGADHSVEGKSEDDLYYLIDRLASCARAAGHDLPRRFYYYHRYLLDRSDLTEARIELARNIENVKQGNSPTVPEPCVSCGEPATTGPFDRSQQDPTVQYLAAHLLCESCLEREGGVMVVPFMPRSDAVRISQRTDPLCAVTRRA